MFVLTSSSPITQTRSYEWFPPCPPPPALARTLPSPTATTIGEKDGPNARPTIATVDGAGIRYVDLFLFL